MQQFFRRETENVKNPLLAKETFTHSLNGWIRERERHREMIDFPGGQ